MLAKAEISTRLYVICLPQIERGKDKRNSGKWKGIFIANKTFSMATIVATVYNSRTCNGIAWNRSILFHSIFLLFHRDPSSVSTFQWQLWSKLNKSLRYTFFFSPLLHADLIPIIRLFLSRRNNNFNGV